MKKVFYRYHRNSILVQITIILVLTLLIFLAANTGSY